MLQLLWIWMRDIETPTHRVFATHLYELFRPWKSTPGRDAENPHSHLNTGPKNYVWKRCRFPPFPDVLELRKQFPQSTVAFKCFAHHSCSIIPPTLQSHSHSWSLSQQPFAHCPSCAEHDWFLSGRSALETEILSLVDLSLSGRSSRIFLRTKNIKGRNWSLVPIWINKHTAIPSFVVEAFKVLAGDQGN